jgi:hypothetical protein
VFAQSQTWRALSRCLLPPPKTVELPGALLARLPGSDLVGRLLALLSDLWALTTSSCAGFVMEGLGPQNMG